MKKLVLIFLISIAAIRAEAYHIIGGDFTAKWVGGNFFEITMNMYRDCAAANGSPFDNAINIAVYDKVTNVRQQFFTMSLTVIKPLKYAGNLCSPPPQVCVEQGTYITTVSIPDNPNGYYLIWERCCRNSTVVNIVTPDAAGIGFYLEIADPALQNSSPVFLNDPLPYMCLNQPFNYNFGGWDQDGDSLSFSFDTPLDGGHTSNANPNPFSNIGPGAGNLIPVAAPYYDVIWGPGYSVNNIINGNPTLTINPVTGKMTTLPLNVGLYAMAVEMKEWRNGTVIGLVRRELEFIVITCNGNNLPNVLTTIQPKFNNVFEINAGDSLCFTITATDPKDSLFITHSGDVFTGGSSGAPYAQTYDTSGIQKVSTTFCWVPTCSQASSNTYKVRFTILDNGCPLPVTKFFDFEILVKRPDSIKPPVLLCSQFINGTTNMVYWGNLNPLDKFFDHFFIYRSVNGGAFTLIDSVFDPVQNFYEDTNAFNNSVIDYCYFVKGVTICNDVGLTSDTLCTLSQLNTKQNQLSTVTIADKNKISIVWKHFPAGPFSKFYIYKKVAEDSAAFSLWQTLVYPDFDSIYDYDVNTSAKSYLYKMTNSDYCDNLSPESNIGKSILLKGIAAPFENKIYYTRYYDWAAGVKNYELYRKKDETATFELLATLTDTIYVDKKLDLTGGNFTYKIRAIENTGGLDEVSWSNEIELIQVPVVYIPNAFTPNNDGLNDTWKPDVVFVKDYTLYIFNRWGQKVFESTDETKSWDGTFGSKECLMDTYLFKLKYVGYNKPDVIQQAGTVTLVR